MYKETINYLKSLKKNNNKDWFDKNRPTYDSTREHFSSLVQTCIDELSAMDKSFKGLKAKDCIFRINRDVRFSKDKSPYKTTYSAFIAKGGRHKYNLPGYYFHIEPGNQSIIGGGLYMPDPAQLKKIRSEIEYNTKSLIKILSNPKFKKLFPKIEGETLVNVPKGFNGDGLTADLLKHKNFFVMHKVSDKDVLSGKLPDILCDSFQIMEPFNKWLNNAIS